MGAVDSYSEAVAAGGELPIDPNDISLKEALKIKEEEQKAEEER